ncbi:hypothetical protein BD309DRAFT_984600 [Dichomitus squalens]|nr:hypothetical protein BD309DRAFT_984600 [Dichomitus squalens]
MSSSNTSGHRPPPNVPSSYVLFTHSHKPVAYGTTSASPKHQDARSSFSQVCTVPMHSGDSRHSGKCSSSQASCPPMPFIPNISPPLIYPESPSSTGGNDDPSAFSGHQPRPVIPVIIRPPGTRAPPPSHLHVSSRHKHRRGSCPGLSYSSMHTAAPSHSLFPSIPSHAHPTQSSISHSSTHKKHLTGRSAAHAQGAGFHVPPGAASGVT